MERNKGNGPWVLYLGVVMLGWLITAGALAYLEIRRGSEMSRAVERINELARETYELRVAMAQFKNWTSTKIEQLEQNASGKGEAAYYDEDAFDTDEYVDDDDIGDGGTQRGRRAIPPGPNLILEQLYKTPRNESTPKVAAEIIVETPNRNYQSQITREERIPLESRNRLEGEGSCCNTVVAHFGGDSSSARDSHASHYVGNKRMYHPDGLFRVWAPSGWMTSSMDSTFSLTRGVVTLNQSPGLYYVYAQVVYYSDSHDTSGFYVQVNGMTVLQCTTTSSVAHHNRHMNVSKSNSCYTGGIVRLVQGDNIAIAEAAGNRYTVIEPSKTFFGLFRVSSLTNE